MKPKIFDLLIKTFSYWLTFWAVRKFLKNYINSPNVIADLSFVAILFAILLAWFYVAEFFMKKYCKSTLISNGFKGWISITYDWFLIFVVVSFVRRSEVLITTPFGYLASVMVFLYYMVSIFYFKKTMGHFLTKTLIVYEGEDEKRRNEKISIYCALITLVGMNYLYWPFTLFSYFCWLYFYLKYNQSFLEKITRTQLRAT